MGVIDLSKFKRKTDSIGNVKKTAPDELPPLPDEKVNHVDAPAELPSISGLPKKEEPTPVDLLKQRQENKKSEIAKKTEMQIKENVENAQKAMKHKPEEHEVVSHRDYKDSLFVEVQNNLSDPSKREEFEKSFLNINPLTEIKERIEQTSKNGMIAEYEKVINDYVETLKHMEGSWRKLQEDVDDKKIEMRKIEKDIDEKTFELKNLILKLHEIRYGE